MHNIYTYLYILHLGREPLSYRVEAVESPSVGKLTGSRLSIVCLKLILTTKTFGEDLLQREGQSLKKTSMIFFSLLTTAFSSIFYGVIVTAVVMAILYAVLKALSKGIVQTPVFFVTGVVLAILLIVQFSLMIGAIQAKDAVDSAEIYMTQLVEDKFGTVGANDSQKVMDAVTEQFPVIGSFLDIADFSGHDIAELPEVMHETMIDYLSSYIWHRVWWIIGIIVVACIVVELFDKKGSNHGNGRRSATSHSNRQLPRHSNRQRIYRSR